MPLTFSFALSQNQTFELRCDYDSRRLDSVELGALIDVCETKVAGAVECVSIASE
jgi:hypothetical protein